MVRNHNILQVYPEEARRLIYTSEVVEGFHRMLRKFTKTKKTYPSDDYFPCGMGFTDNGTLFILEGGSTWPTRPAMLPRILSLTPSCISIAAAIYAFTLFYGWFWIEIIILSPKFSGKALNKKI